MVQPLPSSEAPVGPASDQITEQLGRLLPLVNGRHVARVDGVSRAAGLPSLLSWDADGQLSID